MNHVNDLKAAFECRRPDNAVPIWEIEFHAWDKASGRHVVLGREFENLSSAGQERAMHVNAEIMISVSRDLCFAGLTVPNSYWDQSPGVLAYNVMPGETRFRQFEILKEIAGDELMLIAITSGVMGANYSAEFCEKLFTAPDEIIALANKTLANGIENAKRYRDLGAGAVVTASDIADNSGPFFPPKQMAQFILPYLRQWAEQVRAMGMYAILHTDGNIMPCLDLIADSGINALQAIDPTAGMDISAVKKRVGRRISLCGNIDCGMLVMGTPDTIYQATRKLLQECKADGGLVLGASNAVQPVIPIENYRAIINAWKDHGQY